MSLTLDKQATSSEKDEEFQKLYALLSGLSSKTKPKTENDTIVPMISLTEVGKSDAKSTSKKEPLLTDLVRLNSDPISQTPAFQTSKPVQAKPSPPSIPTPRPLVKNKQQIDFSLQLEKLRRTMEDKCKEMIEDCLNDFRKKHSIPIKLKKKPVAGDIPPPKEVVVVGEFQCEGCLESFHDAASLKYHYFIHRMCNKWKNLSNKEDYVLPPKPLHILVNDLIDDAMIESNRLACRYCHTPYSAKTTLRKHYNDSPVCNRFAFDTFKKIIMSIDQSEHEQSNNESEELNEPDELLTIEYLPEPAKSALPLIELPIDVHVV